MKPTMLFSATAIVASMIFLPATASSEEENECPEGTPRGTICIEEQEIFGDVHSPNAVFVINRDSLVHQQHRDDQSFTNEIVNSVDRDPF